MLPCRVRYTPAALARMQLTLFQAAADGLCLSQDDRRRALQLDHQAWMAWLDCLTGGPLPEHPPLPKMLRRIAQTVFELSVLAEQPGRPRDAARGAGCRPPQVPGSGDPVYPRAIPAG